PLLREPPSVMAVLNEPYWPRSFGGSLWRPAVLASYALDFRISSRPAWFHAMNALWAGVGAGAAALLAASLAGPAIGLAAGLLFAVHPVHVEAVANIVGRAELMAGAGYLLALWCALRARAQPLFMIGVLAAASLAIGSKEHAATLPPVVVLVAGLQAWLKDERWTAARPWIAQVAMCAALPVALYFGLRHGVVGQALGTGGIAPGLEGRTTS